MPQIAELRTAIVHKLADSSLRLNPEDVCLICYFLFHALACIVLNAYMLLFFVVLF